MRLCFHFSLFCIKTKLMIWQEFIDTDIQQIDISMKISALKSVFGDQDFNHLPVFSKGNFVGSIQKEDLQNLPAEDSLENHRYLLDVFFTETHKTSLNLIHQFVNHQTNLLPILDDQKKYVGAMKLVDALDLFGESPFIANEGEVIILAKARDKFAFSEVSQLVESQNAKLSGIFISDLKEEFVEVTLKVEHQGLNEILQTFRRYDYEIKSEHPEDLFTEDLKEHSDYLNKYLDI